MFETKRSYHDSRSPYVWQSRALNFNKQIIKKFNHVQKCKSRQQTHNRFNFLQRKSPILHRLLDVNSSNSSLSSTLSSCFDDREEAPFAKKVSINVRSKYQNDHDQSMIPNHYINSKPNYHSPQNFLLGNRCPLHEKYHPSHTHKHSVPNHSQASINRFTSLNDIQDYGSHMKRYLPSYPYAYLDSTYYSPGYLSHPLYLPASYYPMQYINPSLQQSVYSSKMLPLTYQHNGPYDYNKQYRMLHANKTVKSRCKGHLIVLAIILTVITIGVIMGLVLAITIN